MTDADRYALLLAQCQPTDAAHAAYLAQVATLLDVLDSARLPIPVSQNTAIDADLARRRSRLFNRAFYIAWVPDDAFHALFGTTLDALTEPAAPEYRVSRPPLVYAPRSRRADRSPYFTSVLEHEFVHINQALCDPAAMRVRHSPTGSQLLTDLLTSTHQEFSANFVQGHHWPEAHADSLHRFDLSRTRWCLIRGYTHSIETLLSNLLTQRREPSASAIQTALTQFPRVARRRLASLHLPQHDFVWLAERWRDDVQHAIQLVLRPHKPLPRHPALVAAVAWAGLPTAPTFCTS